MTEDEKRRQEAAAQVLDPITICGKSFVDYYGVLQEHYNPYDNLERLEIDNTGLYEKPLYKVKIYNQDAYQVIKFRLRDGSGIHIKDEKKESQSYDEKLDVSFARAKSMIKQYGLCNPWDYFITLTLDSKKYDRHDLKTFMDDLMQWVRDERKRYKKLYGNVEKLQILVVPETHKDGAWHLHGLLYGLPEPEKTNFIKGIHPDKLVKGGFLNWSRYSEKFGFVSLGKIRDQMSTVLYATKYINKNVEALRDMKGEHLYRASRPLKTAQNYAESYTYKEDLEKYLQFESKFCKTGMAFGVGDTFLLDSKHDDMYFYDWPECSNAKLKFELGLDEQFNPSSIDSTFENTEYEAVNFADYAIS